MMKLTAAQEQIYYIAVSEIAAARNCETFEEYFVKHYGKHFNAAYNTPEKYQERDAAGYAYYKACWEEKKSGIVFTRANSRTLEAMAKKGFIEIINDGRSGIDKIRILNA